MKKNNKFSELGDRMKTYEGIEANRVLIPGIPVCVRLDGRSFHTFTKGLDRPFDKNMSSMMIETTKQLVQESKANIGYTQSDEITLIFIPKENEQINFFNGRIQKLTSVLSSLASAKFNEMKSKLMPEKKQLAVFDCRVWNVPSIEEAINCLIWREMDATKNSISMAASSFYSPKQLIKINSKKKMDLLMDKGINWNDYPIHFKRGSYVQRKNFERTLSPEEIEKLPKEYKKRNDNNFNFIRRKVVEIDLPPIRKVINIKDVIVNSHNAIVKTEEGAN